MQVGSEAIYGRNWGCSYECRQVKHLHFELCYYSVSFSELLLEITTWLQDGERV